MKHLFVGEFLGGGGSGSRDEEFSLADGTGGGVFGVHGRKVGLEWWGVVRVGVVVAAAVILFGGGGGVIISSSVVGGE